jgi:hypothetical protein
MGTPFQDACASASDAVDSTFGEDAIFRPMAGDPNARPSPDPDRPVLPIVAFFPEPYARAFSGPARVQGVKVEHPGHASERPYVDLALAQLPYAPRARDRIERIATGQMFVIAEPKPDGTGRARCDVNLLSPAK